MRLSLEDMETTFSISATDRKVVHAWSDDPVWIAKLDKMAKATESYQDGTSKFYVLPLNEYTFTVRKKRKMSAEERRKSAERLKGIRDRNKDID